MARTTPRIGELEQGVTLNPDAAEEYDRVYDLLQSIAGNTEGNITLFLYESKPGNKTFAGPLVRDYTPDTDIKTIYSDIQNEFGGGDYVLVARQGNKILHRAYLSAKSTKTKEETGGQTANSKMIDESFGRIASAVEKSVLLDKVQAITAGPRKEEKSDNTMADILTALIQQNSDMMKLLLTQRNNPPDSGIDVIEKAIKIIKIGGDFAAGREPGGEEDSLIGLAKAFAPALTSIIQNAPPGRVAAPVSPGLRPAARMLPKAPGKAPIPPPAALNGPDSGNPPPPSVAEVVQTRIVNEINFMMLQPVSEKVFEHIEAYVDIYAPALLDELSNLDEENFLSQVVTLHPNFEKNREWLRAFYHFILGEKEETPQGESPEGDIKPPVIEAGKPEGENGGNIS